MSIACMRHFHALHEEKARFEQRCLSVKQRAEKCVWRSPVPGALLPQPTVLELRFRVPGDRESLGLQPAIQGVWKGSPACAWWPRPVFQADTRRTFLGSDPAEVMDSGDWDAMKWNVAGANSGRCHPSTVGSLQGPPGKAQKGATGRGKMWLVGSQLNSMERARGGGGSCVGAAWLCMCLCACLPSVNRCARVHI